MHGLELFAKQKRWQLRKKDHQSRCEWQLKIDTLHYIVLHVVSVLVNWVFFLINFQRDTSINSGITGSSCPIRMLGSCTDAPKEKALKTSRGFSKANDCSNAAKPQSQWSLQFSWHFLLFLLNFSSNIVMVKRIKHSFFPEDTSWLNQPLKTQVVPLDKCFATLPRALPNTSQEFALWQSVDPVPWPKKLQPITETWDGGVDEGR